MQDLQDFVQDLASLARKKLARYEYFLQDGFYWVCPLGVFLKMLIPMVGFSWLELFHRQILLLFPTVLNLGK